MRSRPNPKTSSSSAGSSGVGHVGNGVVIGSEVVVGTGVVVGPKVVVGGGVVVGSGVVVGGGVVMGSDVVVGADVVTGSDDVVGRSVVDSSVVLGGLVVLEGVLGAGLVVEEPENKNILVLSQPLTVSKTREAFVSNASQTGGNHHQWFCPKVSGETFL